MNPDTPKPKQDILPLGPISPNDIKEYNDNIVQAEKPENQKQTSFEQLNIKDWEVKDITGRDILNLQYFVETTGDGAQAYLLWKHFGHNVTLKQLMERLKKEDVPEYAQSFLNNVVPKDEKHPEGYDPEKVEEKIKNGDILPPLLVYPMKNKEERKDLGLLKVGNIFDGTHRLLEIAKLLSQKDDDYIDNFRMRVAVAHIPMWKYITFTGYQYFKAIRAKAFGKANISQEHIMGFKEQWDLLLQRTGFKE
ncbi:MAG TPA: hypothetical protein VHA74_02575 [Candidatus Dojkabacteria bacterium]|nr:hypothetical protein [Candidatus Dojkabacteria bacterium]